MNLNMPQIEYWARNKKNKMSERRKLVEWEEDGRGSSYGAGHLRLAVDRVMYGIVNKPFFT